MQYVTSLILTPSHTTTYFQYELVKISLLKNFRFARSDETFLRENSLPVLARIFTRIFLIQKFCERNKCKLRYIATITIIFNDYLHTSPSRGEGWERMKESHWQTS